MNVARGESRDLVPVTMEPIGDPAGGGRRQAVGRKPKPIPFSFQAFQALAKAVQLQAPRPNVGLGSPGQPVP